MQEANGSDFACSWCESRGPSSIVWMCLFDTGSQSLIR